MLIFFVLDSDGLKGSWFLGRNFQRMTFYVHRLLRNKKNIHFERHSVARHSVTLARYSVRVQSMREIWYARTRFAFGLRSIRMYIGRYVV